jgi:hypothetical protein
VRTLVAKTWIAAFAVLLAWAPRAGRACSVCSPGTEDANRLAFLLTTALLSFLPLIMVAAFVYWLRRRSRRIEETRTLAQFRA